MANQLTIKLNAEQLKAVKYNPRVGGEPLLIIAGAGTGKTTVITERIKYLIEKGLAKPSEILALTFTEKAATEMQERVDVVMPYGYTQMWIGTFHSFCDRILRSEALHIGLDPRYKLMTEAENIQFIRHNLFKFDLNYFRPLGNPTKFIDGMLQHFSRLQDENINPREYLLWAEQKANNKKQNNEEMLDTDKYKELAIAYNKYEELKVKEGFLDFGDLIVKTLKLFRDRKNVLQKYRNQFRFILVDEFQDTNYAQNELVKLLAGKNRNVTVVADDDQSIYRFRGAAVSNVIQFRKSFPETKIIVLNKNYRSSQDILDRAYDLIQFNNPDRLEVVEKINKKLKAVSVNHQTSPVEFIHKNRVENEAEAVAKVILKLCTEYKESEAEYEYKDFAILVRANNHADPFVRALQRNGIPYQFLGPGKLFRQPEIIDLISYLKVLYDFDDSTALYRVLAIDYFDINVKDLIRFTNFAKRYNYSLFAALEKNDEVFITEETKEKLAKINAVINKHIKLARKETAGQLLYFFLEETGLLQKLLNPDTPDAEKKALNISKFFDKLKTYEVDHEDATVDAVVDWIELSSELGESPLAANEDWTKINAVNILTVHSAKGLEFPVVFLVNLVSQRFPTVERREQIPIPEELIKEVLPQGDYHIEEERRLFYVGMTRAKERLYFTSADYYGEGKREKKLSPFIFEALGEKVVGSEKLDMNIEQLSFLDYKPPEISLFTKQPMSGFHIDYLSYSQIETFKTCPLHFRLKYIIKIPTPQSAAQSFGTTIHAVLKSFYSEIKNGKKPSDDLLYDLLEKNWVKEGYSSKKHETMFFEKGKVYLTGFLKDNFDAKNLPIVMEEPFTLPLTDQNGKEKLLRIGGKIDRVDVLSKNKIEIIDYKTGATIPSQKDVDNNLQLSFYALAAASIPNTLFQRKPENIKLSLYFLDQQEKISTLRTAKQLEDSISQIFEIRNQIENSDFKCSGNLLCEKCEYSLFCRES